MRIASEEAVRACRQCYGSGDCFSCSGRGLLAAHGTASDDCHSCGGSGRCILCSGRGEVAHPADQVMSAHKPTTVAR